MSCDYTHRDGSYVLGALAPAERLDFEQHLAGCADCARSVRELAGLPGLLARVDPAILEQDPIDEPLPTTLLPALVRAVRRTRRRRTAVTAVAAAAAVAAVTVPVAVLAGRDGGSPTAPAVTRALAPVGGAPVHGTVSFASVAWGTKLEVTCTYDPDRQHKPDSPDSVTYALFVRTRDGRTQQVGTWRSTADRTMRLTAATSATRGNIASLEVRTSQGRPVLSLVG